MRRRGGVQFVVAALGVLGVLAAGLGAPTAVAQVHTERLAGTDRSSTAAAVSAATFAPGVEVAYVATGENFPDALAGGPLAGSRTAPILLVGRDVLPPSTAAELARLAPGSIRVLGGPPAVSDAVVAQLAELTAGDVQRIEGPNRFGTAAAVAAAGFGAGVPDVFVATGANFPDALAGGAAGAVAGIPVLLTNGDSIPQETRAALEALQPGRITVLGSDPVVTDAVVAELAGLTAGTVRRLAGPNRFATAAAIAADTFPGGAPVVYLATGGNFPDALAGAPAAGSEGGPLLLVNTECAPAETIAAIGSLGPSRVVVLGGESVVSPAAAALTPCPSGGGAPPPTFGVDPGLVPVVSSLPGRTPGDPDRPVARLADSVGSTLDFVESELLVMAPPGPELDALLARIGGTIVTTHQTALERIDPVHVVVIDPATGDPGALPAASMQLQPGSTGAHGVSSGAGLGTLAASMQASADGMVVGLNALPVDHGFLDGTTTEDATPPATMPPAGLTWGRDAFQWEYMDEASPMGIGIADAWQILAQAGAPLGGPVQIAIIDGGFGINDPDRPANAVTLGSTFGAQNAPGACGGANCAWHGHNVASAAAAVADNGLGSAGAAGPGVRLVLSDDNAAGGTDGTVGALLAAADEGARIFNMSFGWTIPQATASALDPVLRIINGLWLHHNRTFFASAGNAGLDVDSTSCGGGVCSELQLVAPCEYDTEVVCVGGLLTNTRTRHPNSNFGTSVDVFGPYTVFVGPDPDPANATVRTVNGTSFSSPIVAGMAALLWEAYLDRPPFSNPGNTTITQTIVQTASSSPDPQVTRILDAPAAIQRALGAGSTGAPTVQLIAPTGDITLPYATNRVFEATASDAEDGADCCTLRWSSDVDGQMSVARNFFYAFPAPGIRTVSVVATDSSGTSSVPATFRVDVRNIPPEVTVERPLEGQTLFAGVRYPFLASASDANEPGLGCAALTWTSDVAEAGLPVTDCRPRVALGQLGPHVITASAVDALGATTSVSRAVTVAAIPPDSAPIVTISSPEPGQSLNCTFTNLAEGEATLEPGEVTPVTYRWTLTTAPGGTRVLGTSPSVTFGIDPSERGADGIFRLEVTDDDGTGSEQIALELPLCIA